jgi:hypothetical protein
MTEGLKEKETKEDFVWATLNSKQVKHVCISKTNNI